jgi:hypothetical protein
MSTVVSRRFASTPQRDASDTWSAIVSLLTRNASGKNRDELLAVAGVASSVIADQAARDAAIVVTCDGPRTRIYCLYDEAAIEGGDASEDALGFDPLAGNWAVSLPCDADDLSWVRGALKKHSTRITARDKAAAIAIEESSAAKAADTLVLDAKGFLGQ